MLSHMLARSARAPVALAIALLGLAGAFGAGCVSSGEPGDPNAPVATLWLDDQGRAHVAGERFDLDDEGSAKELIAWLRAWHAGHPGETLLMGAEHGTDGAYLTALADRLEEAGVEDWRMNLSARPPDG